MKKEISPTITIAVVAVVVLVIGFFIYQRVAYNPPTPRAPNFPTGGPMPIPKTPSGGGGANPSGR